MLPAHGWHLAALLAAEQRLAVPAKDSAGNCCRAVVWWGAVEQPPRRDRLDRRLAKGRLRVRHIHAVARAIAARRGRVEPGEGELGTGTPAALARRVADLAAKLEAEPNAELRATLGVLLAYQRRFLEDGGDALLDRLAEQRIGALHGRLSVETVWALGTQHVRFAPPSLHAWGDVAEDVARLALDLRIRGANGARFAEALAAAYALAADDYGLYRVLDFYVREAACHLALEAAASAEADEPAEPSLFVEAALTGAGAPRLVVATGGGVASGKSSVAKTIAQRLAAPRIVAERVRSALHLPAPSEMAHELLWEPGIAERVYAGLLHRAEAVLAGGRSAVLDACFPDGARRRAAADLAERHGARFVFVHCDPPAAAIEERLRARDARDGTTLFGWHSLAAQLASRWEAPAAGEPGEVLRVDSEDGILIADQLSAGV